MNELERIIKEAFENVKNAFYRPPIEGPIFIDKGTALLNWLNLEVHVHPPFVEELGEFDDLKVISEGLIVHEFGHYMLHPKDISMYLFLSYEASKKFGEFAEIIYKTFSDFENDVLIIDQDFKRESLKRIREATYQSIEKSEELTPVTAAIYLLYKRKIGLDINIDLSKFDDKMKKEIEDAVQKLEKVIITSKQNYGLQKSQLYRWGDALLPLLEKYGGSKIPQWCNFKMVTPNDVKSLPVDAKEKIKEELGKLIKHLSKRTYLQIKKHFFGEEENKREVLKGIGNGELDEKLADKETVDYYRDAAKEYGIYIRPKRQYSISAVEIPFGKKEWQPNDSGIGIDVVFSGGKILPGLTKSMRKEKIPYPATREVIPRLVLYKDSSGSMPDPRVLKDYATIAGAIILMSYLRSGAEVSVALFDSETGELFTSRDEYELLAKLCGYKGGGTSIDMKRLKEDLKRKLKYPPLDLRLNEDEIKKNPFFRKYLKKNAKINFEKIIKKEHITDLYIITDGGIANIDEVIKFLQENSKTYRPTIIHTGGFPLNIPEYDSKKTNGVYEGITILRAETREDIIKLTKKSVMKNLLSKFEI